MLHLPGVVDTDAVGELDLVQGFLEQLELVSVVPGARELVLVEDPELHDLPLGSMCRPLASVAQNATRTPAETDDEASYEPTIGLRTASSTIAIRNSVGISFRILHWRDVRYTSSAAKRRRTLPT